MNGSSDAVEGGDKNGVEFTGDAERDFERVAIEGNESDVEAVLERYDAELITTVDGDKYYRIEAVERGDAEVAIVYNNGDSEAMEFTEFIRNVGNGFGDTLSYEDILGYDVSERIEETIYQTSGVNYHVTNTKSAIEILCSGALETRNETRGVTNRSMGRAVFTSAQSPIGVYGNVVFEIDISSMVADGFTPDAGKEHPVEEAMAKEAVASEFHIPAFHAEIDPSLSRDTEVFYNDIPIKYLHLDVNERMTDHITAEIEDRYDNGEISDEQYAEIQSVFEA